MSHYYTEAKQQFANHRVSEAQDSSGHEFGEERLIQLLKDNTSLEAADLQRKVIKTVYEFSRGILVDDVTVVAMTCDTQ